VFNNSCIGNKQKKKQKNKKKNKKKNQQQQRILKTCSRLQT
jgi:hypothetical protein